MDSWNRGTCFVNPNHWPSELGWLDDQFAPACLGADLPMAHTLLHFEGSASSNYPFPSPASSIFITMGSIHTPNGGKKGPWWRNLLLPDILDHLAAHEPDSLYAEYPISTVTYAEGYRKITYGDFANVVNGIAWWLQDTIGPGKDNEVLAYIGPNDLRYPALVLGAIKAGYVVSCSIT